MNHLKLLFKLSQHGVKGNTLNWIRAFLLGRTQAVVLERESSSEVPVTSGVPQGSVLGPLLFLLYINDLPQNIQSQVRLFAYDTTVYLTVNSPENAKTLQADLDTLQEWEQTWGHKTFRPQDVSPPSRFPPSRFASIFHPSRFAPNTLDVSPPIPFPP